MPREQIVVHENWDALGLRGTASYDYTIDRVHVPGDATFPFLTPTRFRGGSHYDLGVIPMTTTGMQDSRSVLPAACSTSWPLSRGTRRGWVRETVFAAEHAAAQSDSNLTRTTNLLRQSTVHATTEAADIAHKAYLLAGTSSLRDGALQRCFRDLHAASQH